MGTPESETVTEESAPCLSENQRVLRKKFLQTSFLSTIQHSVWEKMDGIEDAALMAAARPGTILHSFSFDSQVGVRAGMTVFRLAPSDTGPFLIISADALRPSEPMLSKMATGMAWLQRGDCLDFQLLQAQAAWELGQTPASDMLPDVPDLSSAEHPPTYLYHAISIPKGGNHLVTEYFSDGWVGLSRIANGEVKSYIEATIYTPGIRSGEPWRGQQVDIATSLTANIFAHSSSHFPHH